MTTLGFRYHILQNTDVPAPSRARMLEQTVSQWFAALAWSDWCVPSPMHGVRAQETAPFMSIAHLHAAGGSGSDFREFNIVSVDGKPFYRELRDDEHGANIYDEAIDRLWQTVQLLEMVARASHDAVFVDHGRTAIIFDEGTARSVPMPRLDRIAALPDSLRRFHDDLCRWNPFELLLFESPAFKVDDDWFAMMRRGTDALRAAYRATVTARRFQ